MAGRAKAWASGQLSAAKTNEMVMCHHPKLKRGDFCTWSVPPAPMRRTMHALHPGPRFEDVVYNRTVSCHEFLNRSGSLPVSENIFFCAMNHVGVTPSKLVDWRGCRTRSAQGLCVPATSGDN